MSTEAAKLKLIDDTRVVVEDAQALLKATANVAGDRVAELRAQIAPRLERAKDSLREAGEKTNAYVSENPWKSMGVAAIFGAVAGILIARRD